MFNNIIMFDGSIKSEKNIKIGDILMGDNSAPRKVLNIYRIQEKLYKIHQSKGISYIVNENSILTLKCANTLEIINISFKDYLYLLQVNNGNNNLLFGYKVPIKFKPKIVFLDPYLMGNKYIFTMKHISQNYKCTSTDMQLEFLAGIIDSKGYFNKQCKKYVLIFEKKHEKLVKDVIFIAKSLGFSSYIQYGKKITAFINGHNLESIPVKNKSNNGISSKKNHFNSTITIEPLGIGEYINFELDGNQKYLLEDFTVVHNSSVKKNNGLTYSQYVITNNGPIMIGELFNNIRNKNNVPLVLSFNKSKNNFEFKNILFIKRNPCNNVIKITCNKNVEINCTHNHEFYSNNKYISVDNLTIGDEILYYYDTTGTKHWTWSFVIIKNIENNQNNDKFDKNNVYDIIVNENDNYVCCSHNNIGGIIST